MPRHLPLTLATLLMIGAVSAADAQGLRQRWRERMADRAAGAERPAPATGGQTIAYGQDPLQAIDYWKPRNAGAPLILFVHGGGWKRGDKGNATGAAKVDHYRGLGYAFASINYRLVPDATVEQQAQDVADAIARLRRDAATLGFDPGRIVLMGHSAGAHLVALVGTDMRYFEKAGLRPDAVRGVIALDGAAYDVPQQMAQAGRFMAGTYSQAFGTDPARQRALSPTLQAAAPNAPGFLILHVDRADGAAQSDALAIALRRAGTPAQIAALEGRGMRGHREINRSMGDPAYPGTAMVDDYVAGVFAR